MRTFLRSLAVVAVFLCGCVPSVHPIYADKDLVFVPALLGTWAAEGAKETWSFSAHDPKSYRLVHSDAEGRRAAFVAHLAKLGEITFLDLHPAEPGPDANAFHQYHLLRTHTFYVVHEIGPRLWVSAMKPDWLKKHLDAHPAAIRHEVMNGRIVLTAATRELQAFVLTQVGNADAFAKSSEMLRR